MRQALADLDEARAFIVIKRPAAAAAIGLRIRQAILGLSPEQGRLGRVAGTREPVITGSPFVVAYRVGGGTIDVLAIPHGARKCPSAFSG